jgi:hypothetical protein
VDAGLAGPIREMGIAVKPLQSIMGDADDRARFAREVLDFAGSIERPVTS